MSQTVHCPAVLDQVQTEDGKIFSNSCVARNAGYTKFTPVRAKTMQQKTTLGKPKTLDHALNAGLIFVGISTLVLLGILIFKKP